MIDRYRAELATNLPVTALKTLIVFWALFIIVLVVFFIDNPWLLAGIFLYEALP